MSTNLKDKYFYTTNFYSAAFLFSKGLELVNIDRSIDTKKAYFVFLDTPDRELLLHNFNFSKEDSPEIQVDVRKFIMAIKMLKDKLYQGGF